MKDKQYEISDMFDGKVTRITVFGNKPIKFELFVPTELTETMRICDEFFNTVNITKAIKPKPMAASVIIQEPVIENKSVDFIGILKKIEDPEKPVIKDRSTLRVQKRNIEKSFGEKIGVHYKLPCFKQPIIEMRKEFGSDDFTYKEMVKVLGVMYEGLLGDKHLFIYAKAYVMLLLDNNSIEFINKTGKTKQFKFIRMTGDFDKAEMHKRSLMERDSLQGVMH